MKTRTILLCAVLLAVALFFAGCTYTPKNGMSAASVLKLLKKGLQDSGNVRDGGGKGRSIKEPGEVRLPGGRKVDRTANARGTAASRDGEFFYDEYLRLWVLEVYEETETTFTYGDRYFEDEAQTIDAGHELTSGSMVGITPEFYEEDRLFLAGELAGEWDKFRIEWDGSGGGIEVGSGNIPGYGHYSYSGAFSEGGEGGWTERIDYVNGTWQVYTVHQTASFELDLTIETSEGIVFWLSFSADGSGHGTITGDSSLLPATIEWGTDGWATITWRDGTTSQFSVYEL